MSEKPETKKFEHCHDEIDLIIRKQRGRWQLDAINWMDFDDVVQIIKIHIVEKWDHWDQSRPLAPWISTVVSNQIRNLVRNNYLNYTSPCSSCAYNLGDNACGITKSGEQDSNCPLYVRWLRSKKAGYNLKIPVALEHHTHEIHSKADESFCMEMATKKLNIEMKKQLSPKLYRAYRMLFFEDKPEEEVAAFMGYMTSEEGRPIGYKQIKNLSKAFKERAKDIINKEDVISSTADERNY